MCFDFLIDWDTFQLNEIYFCLYLMAIILNLSLWIKNNRLFKLFYSLKRDFFCNIAPRNNGNTIQKRWILLTKYKKKSPLLVKCQISQPVTQLPFLTKLDKVTKKEFSSFKVLWFSEEVLVLQKLLRFVKCLVMLVWRESFQFRLHSSTALK